MGFEFNILDVDINIPSDDIRDYTLFISGHPGCGKTTLVKQIPGSFTIDLDRGAKSHAMMKQQAGNWLEVKEIVKQLVQAKKMNEKAKKAKNNGEKEVEIKVGKRKVILPVDIAIEQTGKIKFVSIDTINQGKQYAKDFILDKKNQEYLEEGKDKQLDSFNAIGWGKDDQLERELMSVINDLRDNGYGVAEVSHIKDKKYNRDTEDEFIKVVPDLQDNERNYLVGAADIEIQIDVEDVIVEKAEKKNGKIVKPAVTEQKTWMYLRANTERAAKSRFTYLPERIEYNYENLVIAVKEAVQKEIEYGKSIYGLTDEKVNELVNKQDEKKVKQTEEMLEENKKEQEKEQEKESINKIIKEIKNKIKALKETVGVPKISEAWISLKIKDPTKVTDIEIAKKVLDNLNKIA